MRILKFAATVCIAFLSTAAVADQCDEVHVLALNMYHEARGEGPDGMQMVGEVTLNRVYDEEWPDNICDVVYQRRQFSWTHVKGDHTPYNKELWEESLHLAEALINGEIDYFNNGATHFLNPNKVSRIPRWAREYDLVGRIGNHVFYARDES